MRDLTVEPGVIVLLARQIRFTCPHCGIVNRTPVRNVGRGGVCTRCGGGIKVPAAHADPPLPDEVENDDLAFRSDSDDLIGVGFDSAQASDASLYDPGRPARPMRSVTAPSAIVAEATLLPTAAQLANSDRAERTLMPPVQTLRTLRRFSRHARPRRHVAARRQQPGTPWWAWMAHGALSVGAVYVLATLYNGSFNSRVDAYSAIRPAMYLAPYESTSSEDEATDLALLDGSVMAEDEWLTLLPKTSPDEKIWLRHERILTATKQQYAVIRATQGRDGQIRVDRVETSERPANFPDDAIIIDRRPAALPTTLPSTVVLP